jgi:hypothetical protein
MPAKIETARITKRVGTFETTFFRRGDIVKGHRTESGEFRLLRRQMWIAPGFYKIINKAAKR